MTTSSVARHVLGAIALAVMVFALYVPALGFAFQLYDDNVYVIDNPFVQAGLKIQSILWAFRDDGEFRRMWHPLTMMSHMLDVQLGGMRPGLHHLTSILLHALTACLLFWFLQRETGRAGRAWCVAALFAVHPLNVEPVAWIAQRKTLLAGCFWLATLLAWGSYVRRPSRTRYGAALGWYVLGWLSKPTMAPLPVVLMLLDYWPWRRWPTSARPKWTVRDLATEKWPFFALAVVFGAWTYVMQQSVGVLHQGVPFSWSSRLTHAAVAFGASVAKTFWPAALTFFYPVTGFTLPFSEWGVSLLLLAAVTGLAIQMRRIAPYLLVGWGWFLVTYLPASGLIIQIGLYFHEDHFMYVPIIGLLICVVWSAAEALERTGSRSWLAVATAVAVIATAGVVARQQLTHWRDSVTLLRREWDAIGEPVLNPRARKNLSGMYAAHADGWNKDGRVAEAVEGYRHALRLEPDNVPVALRLAGLQFRSGQVEQAQDTITAALERNPGEARLLEVQSYLRAQRP